MKERDAIAWLADLISPLSPRDFLLNKARELLVTSGQAKPPFNPFRAIPKSVVRIEIAELSRDGMLVPVKGGFIIKIDANKPRVRQRFTCAHEIGHTYFFDLSSEYPWRPYESLSDYWPEEYLCYAFAEEMLIPEEVLRTTVDPKESFRMGTLLGLARTFGVSVETMARRIGRLQLYECIIILFQQEAQTNSLKYTTLCKIKRYRSRQLNWEKLISEIYTPVSASDQPVSVASTVLKAKDLFRKIKAEDEWHIETRRIGSKTMPTVISILSRRDTFASHA